MIRGAVYFDGSSPNDNGVRYEVIGTAGTFPDDGSIPVGDDSAYTPAETDVIVLSPRGNIKCWPVWDTNHWKFYVGDSDYTGYIFYTIHQEA